MFFPFFLCFLSLSFFHSSLGKKKNTLENLKKKTPSPRISTGTLAILPLGKVGSSLITNVDIDMLRRVMFLMTGRQQPLSQEKCLELLMNQELQWMVLENYSQGDVNTKPFDAYVESLEKERSMAPGSFLKMIQDHGISLEFFKKYLLTSLFWQEYVQEKTRGKINRQKIQQEAEEKTQKIVEDYREKWSCPYYTVLEISIPVDPKEGERGKAKAFQLMNGILEQMQKKK